MTLQVRGLSFTYPGWPPTLDRLDVEVAAGESVFLLGPSGSGKTTLLRCIAGLLAPAAGSVSLDGRILDGLPTHQRGVGMLFQEPALFPHLDALHNVAFGMRYVGIARSERPAEARRWLRLVGLEDKADARIDELSGGQRQRVALARTLAARPQAVLLDEPLSGLDRTLRDELGAKVRDLLRDAAVPALWVTHDQDEAWRLASRVLELVDGRAVEAKPESRPR